MQLKYYLLWGELPLLASISTAPPTAHGLILSIASKIYFRNFVKKKAVDVSVTGSTEQLISDTAVNDLLLRSSYV